MRKNEIKNAKDNELVYDLAQSYASLVANYNLNRVTKQYEKHCEDLEDELLKRGLLTEEQVKLLRA